MLTWIAEKALFNSEKSINTPKEHFREYLYILSIFLYLKYSVIQLYMKVMEYITSYYYINIIIILLEMTYKYCYLFYEKIYFTR